MVCSLMFQCRSWDHYDAIVLSLLAHLDGSSSWHCLGCRQLAAITLHTIMTSVIYFGDHYHRWPVQIASTAQQSESLSVSHLCPVFRDPFWVCLLSCVFRESLRMCCCLILPYFVTYLPWPEVIKTLDSRELRKGLNLRLARTHIKQRGPKEQ